MRSGMFLKYDFPKRHYLENLQANVCSFLCSCHLSWATPVLFVCWLVGWFFCFCFYFVCLFVCFLWDISGITLLEGARGQGISGCPIAAWGPGVRLGQTNNCLAVLHNFFWVGAGGRFFVLFFCFILFCFVLFCLFVCLFVFVFVYFCFCFSF